jgi:hypothetical protein
MHKSSKDQAGWGHILPDGRLNTYSSGYCAVHDTKEEAESYAADCLRRNDWVLTCVYLEKGTAQDSPLGLAVKDLVRIALEAPDGVGRVRDLKKKFASWGFHFWKELEL